MADLPFAGELIQVRAGPRRLGGRRRAGPARRSRCPCSSRRALRRGQRLDRRHTTWACGWSTTGSRRTWLPRAPPARSRRGSAADPLVRQARDPADSSFYPWLERELWRRADHHCAATMTRSGELTRPSPAPGRSRLGSRHEKDDADRSATGGTTCWAGTPRRRSTRCSPQARPFSDELASRRPAPALRRPARIAGGRTSAASWLHGSPNSTPGTTSTGPGVAARLSRLEAERRALEQSSRIWPGSARADRAARARSLRPTGSVPRARRTSAPPAGSSEQVRRQAGAARARLAEPDAEVARARFDAPGRTARSWTGWLAAVSDPAPYELADVTAKRIPSVSTGRPSAETRRNADHRG